MLTLPFYATYIRCVDSYDPADQFTSTTAANMQDTTGKYLLQSAAWSPGSRTLLTTERAGTAQQPHGRRCR